MRWTKLLVGGCLSVTLAQAASGAVLVRVDNAVEHQVMEGFGATHGSLVYDRPGGDTLTPAQRAEAIEKVYGQVGLSMGNVSLGIIETTAGWDGMQNDNNDPFAINPGRFQWTGSDAVKEKLVDLAEPYGFDNYYLHGGISSRWANPWMRSLSHQDYVDEGAEMLLAAAIHWRDEYGIVPRYIMPFNEPLSGNRELQRGGGVGTTQLVVDLIKAAGARLRAEGFGDMMFVVPSEETVSKSLQTATAILNDPEARQYVGAIAYHPYPYGSAYSDLDRILSASGSGNPDPGAVARRGQLRDLAAQYGLPVWMTEVSHGGWSIHNFDARDFVGLRGRAIHIHDELEYADAAAFFGMNNMWDMTHQRDHMGNSNLYEGGDTIVLINNDTGEVDITGMGYAIGHYARWINQGAVRIDATSDDPLLQISAFRDLETNSLVFVLINNHDDEQTVQIELDNLGPIMPLSFVGEQSTEAAFWQPIDPFFADPQTGFSIALPGYSVTSLSAVIPEPSSQVLLAAFGLTALVGYVWRRRKQR